ncbi:MAG: hypothetical protein AAFX50_21560, partial [Acidobacteriota bacterium]
MTTKPFTACALALALTVAVAGPASADPPAPTFDAVGLGDGVAFTTDFHYGTSQLRVVGPRGFVFEKTFSELDDLVF